MYSYVLLIHLLAATVWTGGHLVLACSVLPQALAARDPTILLKFESAFERIGMPALAIQAASGIWLAYTILPDMGAWLSFSLPARLIVFKLSLLAITIIAAVHAKLRLIPRLSPSTLPAMARRVILVTAMSVLFVLVGVSFRGGLLA